MILPYCLHGSLVSGCQPGLMTAPARPGKLLPPRIVQPKSVKMKALTSAILRANKVWQCELLTPSLIQAALI